MAFDPMAMVLDVDTSHARCPQIVVCCLWGYWRGAGGRELSVVKVFFYSSR